MNVLWQNIGLRAESSLWNIQKKGNRIVFFANNNILHWWLRHQYERHSDDLKKEKEIETLNEKNLKKMWGYQKKLEKIFWENSRFMKKNLGVPKKNWENLWQKLEKMWGTKNKTGDKSAIPKKVQIFECFKYCRQKSANLKCFKYCPSKYCRHKYCTHFWEVWKFWVYTQM